VARKELPPDPAGSAELRADPGDARHPHPPLRKALETGCSPGHTSAIVNLDGSPESNLIVAAFGTVRRSPDASARWRHRRRRRICSARHRSRRPSSSRRDSCGQIEAGEEAQLQLLLDGTDTTPRRSWRAWRSASSQRYNTERAIKGLWARGVRPDRGLRLTPARLRAHRIRYNPGRQYLGYRECPA